MIIRGQFNLQKATELEERLGAIVETTFSPMSGAGSVDEKIFTQRKRWLCS